MNTSEELKRIGTKVAFLRKQLGWSQAVLAEKAGITNNSVFRLENITGNPGVETIIAVAKGLGVSISLLVQEDDLLAPNSDKREFRRQLAENLIDKIDTMDKATWEKCEEIIMTLRCLRMLGQPQPRATDENPDDINS